MAAWRCPQCNAAIKVDADWCGQCYADLRPPPPPQQARPLVTSPGGTGQPGDPVFAPHDSAGTPASPLWTDASPAKPTGWPCADCGTLNDFELTACVQCGTPFGAGLSAGRPELPGDRRTRLFVAIGIALAFVVLVAVLSMRGATPVEDPAPPPPLDEPAG
ncbi:MAG TPA: zinc ribbon domain-containing protein [Mycobacteriales bacterium]|nr:zinc ribbon domain-containing protein [Mycobacteriales bacterium]